MSRRGRDPDGILTVRPIPDPRPRGEVAARKDAGKGMPPQTSSQPVQYPNTLRSRGTARILEAIGEGIIKGFHQGTFESVFLDDTPVIAANGVPNFYVPEGHFRAGYPSQDPVPGYPISEVEVNVSHELTPFAYVIRRTSQPGLSAIRFKLRVAALFMTETDGDLNSTGIDYAFDYRVDNGPWINFTTSMMYGKTMSPYEWASLVQIPPSTDFIELRAIRLEGPAQQGESNTIFWSSFTEIIDGQLSYDDTALVGMVVDAQAFPVLPKRSYWIDGLIVKIPSNYNGETHGYVGDWDGTFKDGWTNNPAWVLYALLTNERWGIGRDIDAIAVDKWSFYEAAAWNDGAVSDGKGGVEPRHTCNCIINTQQDAWTTLTAVASSMLATLYYANGTVFIAQDRLIGTVERLFGPADVENGIFEYVGTDYRSRWTAAAIQWNDPDDKYNAAVELVQDPTLLAQQGYRETQQPAFGCTSRAQAMRFGRWLIYTSQYETEVVSFTVALENADLRPGDRIAISDPNRAGVRLAGRLLHDDGPDTVTLDQVPGVMINHPQIGWQLFINAGTAEDPQNPPVVTFVTVLDVLPNQQQLRVAGKTGPIFEGWMWLASATNAVEPTPWRVGSIADKGEGKYEVMATEYDQQKWAYIEQGITIPDPPFSQIPSGPLIGPTNLTFREFIYLDGVGMPQFGVVISWSASIDPRVANYILEMSGPSGDYRQFNRVTGVAQEVLAMRQGPWHIVVTAFDNLGRRAIPVVLDFIPIGLTEKPLPPSALYITPQGGNLTTLTWTPTAEIDVLFYWVKWTSNLVGATWDRATTSIARVDRNTTQVNTPTRSGTFMVKSIDSLGQESDAWAEAILEAQQTERSIFLNRFEQPAWAGNLNMLWHHNVTELWLPPPVEPEDVPPGVFPGERGIALNKTPTRIGVYDFALPFDLGAVTLVTMTAIVEGYGTRLGRTMNLWVPLASATPLAMGTHNSISNWIPLAMAVPMAMGSSKEWDAHIEAAVSQDGVTFDDYFPLKSTVITGRAFKWRMVGTLYDLLTTLRALQAGVIIEVPLRSIQGNDVVLDGTGHLTVTYVAPFLVTPTVQLTARQSLAPGGNIVIVESDRNHFRVEHRSATNTVVTTAASIDYFVQGYGGHS
jgi:predicted phage tail protein